MYIWHSIYFYSIKTMELGAYRPDTYIFQANNTTAARNNDHQELCEPHLHKNDWSWHRLVQISEVPCFDLDEIAKGNSEYIDKLFARVINMFNQKWFCRYPRPHEVFFNNGSKFKQDLTPLLKGFIVTPI